MKRPFNQSVKEHLESVSLNEKQLDQLMEMQARYTYRPAVRKRRTRFSWYQIAGVSALLMFGVVVVTTDLFNMADNQSQVTASIIQRIADEVASNHLKMKPLEVKGTEISEVQAYFSKLEFLPYNAQPLANNPQIVLAGGRYCSIQGAKAAQLRYKDKKGGYVTLFEAAYSPVLFANLPNIDKGETPVITYTKGIKVSMWVEKNVVMVSTEKFR